MQDVAEIGLEVAAENPAAGGIISACLAICSALGYSQRERLLNHWNSLDFRQQLLVRFFPKMVMSLADYGLDVAVLFAYFVKNEVAFWAMLSCLMLSNLVDTAIGFFLFGEFGGRGKYWIVLPSLLGLGPLATWILSAFSDDVHTNTERILWNLRVFNTVLESIPCGSIQMFILVIEKEYDWLEIASVVSSILLIATNASCWVKARIGTFEDRPKQPFAHMLLATVFFATGLVVNVFPLMFLLDSNPVAFIPVLAGLVLMEVFVFEFPNLKQNGCACAKNVFSLVFLLLFFPLYFMIPFYFFVQDYSLVLAGLEHCVRWLAGLTICVVVFEEFTLVWILILSVCFATDALCFLAMNLIGREKFSYSLLYKKQFEEEEKKTDSVSPGSQEADV